MEITYYQFGVAFKIVKNIKILTEAIESNISRKKVFFKAMFASQIYDIRLLIYAVKRLHRLSAKEMSQSNLSESCINYPGDQFSYLTFLKWTFEKPT